MGNQQASYTFTEKDVEILVKTSGKSENEIRQWYNEFRQDSNNTGRMNKRQFQVYYAKLKKNPNLEKITEHIFRAFDVDHSGKFQIKYFNSRFLSLYFQRYNRIS
jgi:Ca2+-binding EF-hand superfamily protein